MDCQLAQPGFWLDAAQALFVLCGVFIAGLGLRTWRHELIGRRKIEVAEEALGAFLKVWNAIDAARSPHGHAGEGASRPGRDKEPDGPARDQKDVFYVPIERLQRHKETFKELEMITPKAIIYFGDGVLGPIKEINDVLINLDRSATNLLETFDNQSNNLTGIRRNGKERLFTLVRVMRSALSLRKRSRGWKKSCAPTCSSRQIGGEGGKLGIGQITRTRAARQS